MIPFGKWLFIWQIKNCAGGNFSNIATDLARMGITGVSIKVAQGISLYNLRWDGSKWVDDLLPPFVQYLKNEGLYVNGWHYVLGDNPSGEALTSLSRINQLKLDGFEVDAESEYKTPGKGSAATVYMNTLKNSLPADFDVGLTSYRYPTIHPEFPWAQFCAKVDYHMPQVYWNPPYPPNYGPVPELNRSVRELRNVKDLPIVPAGRAYIGDGHSNPLPKELTDFMTEAKRLGLPGCTFWAMDFLYLHSGGQARADAIEDFLWESPPPPGTLEERMTIAENKIARLEQAVYG